MFKKLFSITSILILQSCISTTLNQAKQLPSGNYELDMGHSSVHFKIKHLDLSNYTARFTKFDANLNFDSKNVKNSKLKAKIYVDSIKTDYSLGKKNFDMTLAKDANFFNSKLYPTIDFVSTKIRRIGLNSAKIYGNLTMLGVTKEISFDVKLNGSFLMKPFSDKPALGFSATTKINRSDFGLDYLIPQISDQVEIIIETEFHKSS